MIYDVGGIALNQNVRHVVFKNVEPGRGHGTTALVETPRFVVFLRHPNQMFQHDNARAHTTR